jgi:hypothetical protein
MSNLSDFKTALGIKQTAAVTSDTVPYFLHVQETFPYWTNRVIDSDYQFESEQLTIVFQRIAMRLVTGHIGQSGYAGEGEDNIDTYIQAVRAEFADCNDLAEKTYVMVPPPSLISDNGFEAFPDPSLPVMQAGVEFILEARIWHDGP